ncbi:hypothetical protein H6G54_02710 [Anabaena cylindrica FACHB-243]|uniref:hypothetical protein n=1 Tax=Anabaena TaxID=1163 RepID=UPI000306EEAF|nr:MULTISPECIES: hypothetical protein [Anabaena]MBD2416638.1 hypothetical protein [Anabaena cylindrica FACHB-243]MBY5306750.1 hypothetical protein [Anabaena sp. CCAP 1446/1C]MCM2410090.1 hypothetical protein [Anabaena sp. CCAP 1446/1C]
MTNGFRTVVVAVFRASRLVARPAVLVIAGVPQLFLYLLCRAARAGSGKLALKTATGLGGWAIVLDLISLFSLVIGHFTAWFDD